MKTRRLAGVVLILLGGYCAAGARAPEGKPERRKPQTIEVLHTWYGILPDAALRKHLPENGFVLDQESWARLWKAWRVGARVPAVDFQQQMVLVFTAEGPNSVGCDKLTLDGRGDLRANVMSTLIGGPGFGYLMLCIPRAGVKSVNGTPLPGVKLPARRPRPLRPEEPGAVPGSPGSSPPGVVGGGDSSDASSAEPEPGVVESPPFSGVRPRRPAPGVVASPPPPIVELERPRLKRGVWDGATWSEPLVLKSEKDAAEHLDGDELARLTGQVDFGKQLVLLFAWRGSGQDRLEYAVAESYPEQVFFTYKPGRTRDLIEHVRAYALRSNVKWSIRQAVPRQRSPISPDTPVQSPPVAP